jgi:hypothetical protein
MSRIFISYRRTDSAGYAGRLYDHLTNHFGENLLFMDVDNIQPGEDFVEVLERAVSSCTVLVAVIGPEWLTVTDSTGLRRLENPLDFVRIEIITALERNVLVIPVLVGGAKMPPVDQLPDGLRGIARRNALEVRHESFGVDSGKLIDAIEKAISRATQSDTPSANSDQKIVQIPPSSAKIKAEASAPSPVETHPEVATSDIFGSSVANNNAKTALQIWGPLWKLTVIWFVGGFIGGGLFYYVLSPPTGYNITTPVGPYLVLPAIWAAIILRMLYGYLWQTRSIISGDILTSRLIFGFIITGGASTIGSIVMLWQLYRRTSKSFS